MQASRFGWWNYNEVPTLWESKQLVSDGVNQRMKRWVTVTSVLTEKFHSTDSYKGSGSLVVLEENKW
jgi:hypothetical protein